VGPTVLIVDDQVGFLQVARELLEKDGFTVVGEATSATAALELARRLRPEIVLLDVRLPDGSGVDVARALRSGADGPHVVLTSTADYAREARACGVPFIAKVDLSGTRLRAAIAG
jgi:DNA-binding NarL/FixJ family response regulator